MFALLGDIQFDLITYFDGLESQFGADYAQHARIEGKPRLQFVGDRLDEIRIALAFHQHYCDPEVELARLRRALLAHQAMALVLGNGDYKGWFVPTDVQAIAQHTDNAGTLIALEANVTLMEYVGDPKNLLPTPGVQASMPPTGAVQAAGAGNTLTANAGNSLGAGTRMVVAGVSQAQSAMRAASNAVSFARQVAGGNPVSALSRIPGLFTDIKRIADPLIRTVPVLGDLIGLTPAANGILRSVTASGSSVRNAQDALAGVSTANIAARLGAVADQLGNARQGMAQAAPAVSRMAASVITRRV